MNRLAVKLWCSLLLCAVAVYGAMSWNRWRDASSRAADSTRLAAKGPVSLASFTFTERSGKPFALKDLDGQVWIASFFFSSCPGPCRSMNQAIAALQQQYKDTPLKFVSITVDPGNDSPTRLAKYADTFAADPQRWFFLTGPLPDTRKLGNHVFHVTVESQIHTDRLILLDRQGTIQGAFRSTVETELNALKRRLDEILGVSTSSAPPSAADPTGEPAAGGQS